MHANVAKLIAECGAESGMGGDFEFVPQYMGRGMHGAVTAAVTFGTLADLFSALVLAGAKVANLPAARDLSGEMPDPDQLADAAAGIRVDSLGMGKIAY